MKSDETPPDQAAENEEDGLASLARVIFEEMNVEPRRMNIAIDLARAFLPEIRLELIRQGLRAPQEGEKSPC